MDLESGKKKLLSKDDEIKFSRDSKLLVIEEAF